MAYDNIHIELTIWNIIKGKQPLTVKKKKLSKFVFKARKINQTAVRLVWRTNHISFLNICMKLQIQPLDSFLITFYV